MTTLVIRVPFAGGDDGSDAVFETGLTEAQFEAAVERVRPAMRATNPDLPEETFRAIVAQSAAFLVPPTQAVVERDGGRR